MFRRARAFVGKAWRFAPLARRVLETVLSAGSKIAVDLGSRMHGLAALAKALTQGDHALAAIVLAQSQFPAFPDKGAWARINNAATMIDDRLFTRRPPLALLLALLSGVPALARNVECPAVWPGDSSKSKVKDATVYTNDQTEPPWEEAQHGTRVEVVVYGEFIDLQCLYANRPILVIPLHGEDPARVPFGGSRIPSKRTV